MHVDGGLISATECSYNASTDLLTYDPPRLARGEKPVKIAATDAAKDVGIRSWAFTIN